MGHRCNIAFAVGSDKCIAVPDADPGPIVRVGHLCARHLRQIGRPSYATARAPAEVHRLSSALHRHATAGTLSNPIRAIQYIGVKVN